MPGWIKLAAVLVVVVVLAVTNTTAARRERRAARAASDLIAATVAVTADVSTLRSGSVSVTISVTNNGPVLQLRAPRVQAAGYALEPVGPVPPRVAPGQTVLIAARLKGGCRAGADVPPRVVARVVPPSGRLHEVSAGISPDFGALLCGAGSIAEALEPTVSSVRRTAYAVEFRLAVHNRSATPVVIDAISGEGFSFGVRDGLPVTVPAGLTTTLLVRLAIPACAQLPEPLDAQRLDALPFGVFELELSDGRGQRAGLPYVPDPGSALKRAMRALAHDVCPRVVL